MKPGRNDPCPCGSGRKYKQCCLLAAAAAHSSPAELAWRRIRRANEGLVGRMMQFTFEAYGEAALDEAWAEFMLWDAELGGQSSPKRFPAMGAASLVARSGRDQRLIEIDEGRLSVHVNSDKRAAKFKRIVSKALGARVKYRATEIQSAERALEEAMDGERATPDVDEMELAEHPAIKAQLTGMLSQHYDDWLRQKIPALGGKTPLQAAKDTHGREMLEALVAQIERDGQRMTPPLDESIPRRLREKLGLGSRNFMAPQ
jgi:hypothetical protein